MSSVNLLLICKCSCAWCVHPYKCMLLHICIPAMASIVKVYIRWYSSSRLQLKANISHPKIVTIYNNIDELNYLDLSLIVYRFATAPDFSTHYQNSDLKMRCNVGTADWRRIQKFILSYMFNSKMRQIPDSLI